jgi:hypothetical protein
MKKYLVINVEDGHDNFTVEDLTELISEMYSQELVNFEFEVVKGWFFENYKVFVSESDIIELNNEVEE